VTRCAVSTRVTEPTERATELSERAPRLGLLGGTFDPPHYGHLLAAQESAWLLKFERVLFMPARQNPLKEGDAITPVEDRCEMVVRAIADNPLFDLSRRDMDRPPPSYTADLLRALKAEVPDRELYFLVGADILPELPKWHQPDEILRLARLVVVNRPESPLPDIQALETALPGARARVDLVFIPGVAISARYLRARVAAGQPIRYLTPPAVERYILEKGLYQSA
jgi:nicotinate-nucleotide adenylyltransferase